MLSLFSNPADRANSWQVVPKKVLPLASFFSSSPFFSLLPSFPPSLPPPSSLPPSLPPASLLLFLPLLQLVRARSPLQPKGIGGQQSRRVGWDNKSNRKYKTNKTQKKNNTTQSKHKTKNKTNKTKRKKYKYKTNTKQIQNKYKTSTKQMKGKNEK